jgi:hypothetical protein
LEKVVKELEAGDLPLERSIELFERGMSLSDDLPQTARRGRNARRNADPQGGQNRRRAVPSPKNRESMNLRDYLAQQQRLVDAELDRLVPPETTPPETIHRAMRYSLFAGGKRIRPILCLEAARTVAGDPRAR